MLENESFFHDWIACNYSEFNSSETEGTALNLGEISLFLSTKKREEKVHIYHDFMTSNGLIEDMNLNKEERMQLEI